MAYAIEDISLTINGPAKIRPNQTGTTDDAYEYTAHASGGTSPYSYSWSDNVENSLGDTASLNFPDEYKN